MLNKVTNKVNKFADKLAEFKNMVVRGGRKIAIIIAFAPVAFTACDPNDKPIDPVQERIETLTKSEVAQAPVLRESAADAKKGIEAYFDGKFTQGAREHCEGNAKNLLDSSKAFVFIVDRAIIELGDPIVMNDAELKRMKALSNTYIVTVNELNLLIEQKQK